MKIGHIALSVSDIDRSVGFYRKNFGFKCGEKFQIKSSGLEISLLRKDDVTLELFQFKDCKPLPQYRKDLEGDLKTIGTKHFAFEVASIEEAYRKLKKAKVKFATDISVFENGLRYFFIKDPDGILIELMETHK